MKSILVTGSCGFIGSHLCDKLENLGYNLHKADIKTGLDLSNWENVKNLPDVEIVVHLAALNGTKFFYQRPFDVIRNNLLPTQYLLDRYAGKIEKFIFSSSCETYAGTIDTFNYKIPTDEQVPLSISDVTNPRWSYAASKIANEVQVNAAYHQTKQNFIILRYHNVYGPRQINHFIPEFYGRIKKGDLNLYGHSNTRSFMYVSDAVDATVNILETQNCNNEIINIGVSDERTIKEVAELICRYAKINKNLILNNAPIGSVSRRLCDTNKLKKIINFKPKISLEQGIKLTLDSL